MAYTIHDTPETVARIEHDLRLIQDEVTKVDPALRSLVLTGGFARGEGAVLHGAPQNDYDLVAIRGNGRPKVSYEKLRSGLEERIGLHLDLAPVPAWRLPLVGGSIFWYETAWRGRILWGEDLLGRIRVRHPRDLKRTEALRLLVNRAAGLLLVTESDDPHAHRIQAAKGLLSVLDAHLFAAGRFPPTQTERWTLMQSMHEAGTAPSALEHLMPSLAWAYHYKVDPGGAPDMDAKEAWHRARSAILDAVPPALRHAGFSSLEAYARSDGLIDRAYYFVNSRSVPGARRLVAHPTGQVRAGTIHLLEAAVDGRVRPESAAEHLGGITDGTLAPLALLHGLRGATLQ